MNKLIFFIFSCILFEYNTLADVLYKHSIFLDAAYGAQYVNHNKTKEQIDSHYLSINAYNDFIWDTFSITSTINYTNNGKYFSNTYNKNMESERYFELSEFALNYAITPKDIISFGAFSFKNGVFSENTLVGIKQSDSLTTLYHLNLGGVFYTRHLENTKVQFGYAVKTEFGIIPNDRYDSSQAGTDILFLFSTYKKDKQKIIFNISNSELYHKNEKTNENIKFGDLTVSGIGYQYDDREESGVLLYSILGGSKTNIDSTNFDILPLTGDTSIRNDHSNKEGVKYGYSFLTGIKKDFDAMFLKTDMFVGTEYFYASKYWASYNTGRQELDGYDYGDLGHSSKTYIGIEPNPKLKISVVYRYIDTNYRKISGSNNVRSVDDYDQKIYIRINKLF